MNEVRRISEPTNGAESMFDNSMPYVAHVKLRGVADLLLHAYNPEAVEAKSTAKKGSTSKKSDNLESYVYRTQAGDLAIPGEYVRQSIIGAAKFRQDPRSPRKSAQDLFKASVVSLTDFASLGVKKWDYEDRRRVMVQRSGITRVRPAMRAGWNIELDFQVNVPEYVTPDLLHEVLEMAGRLIGIADFRPSYGRVSVVSFVF